MSYELTGTDPATGQGFTVSIENGVVSDIKPGPNGEPFWLAPGLVDLQVNGYAGFDVNADDDADDPAGIIGMAYALFRKGVTTIVPTVITAAEEQIINALRRVGAARAADPLVRHAIPYAHVEGPHLSREDGPRGVHPADQIRPPDAAEFHRWQRASHGLVGLVTLSPHWDEAPGYIAELTSTGVQVAIGHTHATSAQIAAAVDAGATLSTHLGNGAHPLIQRHPNYIWAQLADDRLTAGLIADGHHLPDDTLTTMLRAKGPDRAFLVSDAVALAGQVPGRYRTPVGGDVELSENGRLSYRGTALLAGAARPLSAGVATVANLNVFNRTPKAKPDRTNLHAAIRLATWSPGRFCGGHRKGVVRIGAPADLIRFRWSPGELSLDVRDVVVAGRPLDDSRD